MGVRPGDGNKPSRGVARVPAGDAGKAARFVDPDRVWRGRERITQRGFIAPWLGPPRKDGTLSATGPPSAPLMTAEDESVKL